MSEFGASLFKIRGKSQLFVLQNSSFFAIILPIAVSKTRLSSKAEAGISLLICFFFKKASISLCLLSKSNLNFFFRGMRKLCNKSEVHYC